MYKDSSTGVNYTVHHTGGMTAVYRTLILEFPFETILNEIQRMLLMKQILDF
jgi:hypothetical protein